MPDALTDTARADAGSARAEAGEWARFRATPLRMQGYLVLVGTAAIVLPLALDLPVDVTAPVGLTVGCLIAFSVLNVEISRAISGGLAWTHQPHKALSAWAFSTALLLPPAWLLVVVPVTYAHARWRGLRVPLWKWVGSAGYLVLCGVAAALVRHAYLGHEANWMHGDGGQGLIAMVAAMIVFLGVEALLFSGSALLNHAEDEVWLRQTLTGRSFYLTEIGVLLMGGLLAAVWTGGAWFGLLFIPIYALAQRAALHEPLRERAGYAAQLAEMNAELATKNAELAVANEFKVDLIGMLGHEIGNPLTAVRGFVQIGTDAAAAGDARAARRALEVVERKATQMSEVLADILGLVADDRRAMAAEPELCLLAPRLEAAASGRPADRRPQVECPADLAAFVQPGHLDQILANLLSNADKYAGGATAIRARQGNDGLVELAVRDGGPGVPDSFQGLLFERFSRASGTAGQTVGTGLGLFISRELARANGGDVHYRQDDGSGATFVVLLPSHAS